MEIKKDYLYWQSQRAVSYRISMLPSPSGYSTGLVVNPVPLHIGHLFSIKNHLNTIIEKSGVFGNN